MAMVKAKVMVWPIAITRNYAFTIIRMEFV